MEIKIAIIGGKLRGMEIAILAKTAGIYSVLIDKDRLTPASGLCEENYIFDVRKKEPALLAILKNVDIVIPAVEQKSVLEAIEEMCREINLKVAFDFTAYDVSSSRVQADYLIKEENLPHLTYFPDAKPPYVLKPAVGNRRRFIRRVDTLEELEFLMSRKDSPKSWIAQEFTEGPVFSVEVVGRPGSYKAYEIVQLHINSDFDCGLVDCPVNLSPGEKKNLMDNAVLLAEKIQLTGLMNIEAVRNSGELKIMEINAIFPTQTPTSIFYATGINLLIELLKVFADGKMEKALEKALNTKYEKAKHVVLEDFQFTGKNPTFKGEANLRGAGPLKVMVDFFGSDYTVTDYLDDDHEWQAILINVAESDEKLMEKRIGARETLLEHCRKQL